MLDSHVRKLTIAHGSLREDSQAGQRREALNNSLAHSTQNMWEPDATLIVESSIHE